MPKKPDPFYSLPQWRAVRLQALRRDGWRCVMCGADVRGKGASRVDHIRARREAPALGLVLANLRTLCAPCDNRRHAEKGGADKPRIRSDGFPDGWC